MYEAVAEDGDGVVASLAAGTAGATVSATWLSMEVVSDHSEESSDDDVMLAKVFQEKNVWGDDDEEREKVKF
ncbi:hypothetical protein LJB42_001985 [Komagataella kurtzmanii]|nr:hypothetical protein LJB42_001985 [Komagataella kurtzmanii]